jgi:hypothetical protein
VNALPEIEAELPLAGVRDLALLAPESDAKE